jgi:hypothetical protein
LIAVLVYETFRASRQDIEIRSTGPVEPMQWLIVRTFSALLKNQKFIALLNNENLHTSGAPG